MSKSKIVLALIVILIVVVAYSEFYGFREKQSITSTSTQPILSCSGDETVMPNGVYLYTENGPENIDIKKLASLDDKPILLYFHNNACPHCREFHPTWCKLVEDPEVSGQYYMVRVVCDWFTYKCTSRDAMSLFANFQIASSPTLIIAEAKGSTITGYDLLIPGDPVSFTHDSLKSYLLSSNITNK